MTTLRHYRELSDWGKARARRQAWRKAKDILAHAAVLCLLFSTGICWID